MKKYLHTNSNLFSQADLTSDGMVLSSNAFFNQADRLSLMFDVFSNLGYGVSVSGTPTSVSKNGFINSAPSTTEYVDIAASTSTTTSIAVGQSAQGSISSSGDHDWYSVSLVTGHSYSFAAIGTGLNSLGDTNLNIRDSSGVIKASDDDSGPGLSSVVKNFTATYTGTYYIDVGAYSSRVGQYGVSVVEASAANGFKPSYDISMGAGAVHVNDTVGSGAPLDWNQVMGTARGTGTTVSYSFRETATYASENSSFSKCTSAEITAISNILTLYSDICNVSFTRVSGASGYSNNAQIVIANYNYPASAAGAYAYYPSSDATGGDLWLNTASVNPNSISQGTYSWFAVMHELGHALGLSHPGDYNAGNGSPTYSNSAQFIEDTEQYSIMSYFGGSNTGQTPGAFGTASTPLLFDIAELQTLYGVNTSTRSGNTVYGFNNTAGSNYAFSASYSPYCCIWDGGGIDSLDASGYSQAQSINLNSGSFSNVGGGISNISIAMGATIENAIGGAGNDILTGNSADNVLNGGAGADTLIGGAGNDTYVVDNAGDIVTEDANAGTDTIQTILTTYSLAALANVENLTFTGTGNATLTGNAAANILNGGTGNDTLNGGTGADTLIGGLGKDTFVFKTGDSGQIATTLDKISDYSKGAVGTGDLIDFSSTLTIGGSAATATSSQASINLSTAITTFATGSGTTLSDALLDIATRMTSATDSVGEFALFQVNRAGDYYAFISDGIAGVGANDVLIQLVGITSISGVDLTSGNLTITS